MNTFLILLAAVLAVFWEAAFGGLRHLLGAQVDLLPSLMVYAAMTSGLRTVTLLAVGGGVCFDALSANPLGVTVLPLYIVGLTIHTNQRLIPQGEVFVEAALGLGASALVPLLVLLFLLTTGRQPLFGWGTIWQLIVMSVGGAVAAPLWFEVFSRMERLLVHRGAVQSSFRPDREIRRGK